jgi:hypothetical protein
LRELCGFRNFALAIELPELSHFRQVQTPENEVSQKWDELFMTFGHNDG